MTTPIPSLDYFQNDIDAFIAKIEERGVHPTETGVVVRALRELWDENDELLEELAALGRDLEQAKDRIATLETRLHNERKKVR